MQPLDQFGGRKIHQFEHRIVENAVGHGLADFRARDLTHGVSAAFDMLDVQRGDDVNARVEQFRHVLPALRMPRAGRVRVREFIHQHDLWTPGQCGVEIEFRER